jgi:hypothetical protein
MFVIRIEISTYKIDKNKPLIEELIRILKEESFDSLYISELPQS